MSTPEDAWIDVLAGRKVEAGAERDVREARALRAQILAQRPPAAPVVATLDPAREAALLARARADGLISIASAPLRESVRRWRRSGGFAAAAVVVLALALTLTWHPAPPRETVRGIEDGVVHLEAPDPQLLKRQLIVELTAAGLKVSGYEKLGSVGIDADLPDPPPPAVLKVLDRHHIPIPSDGVLVVEITATGR